MGAVGSEEKLDRNKTRHIIRDKVKAPDGSLVVRLKNQYNTYKATGYME